jgi:hypothetical protein
LELAGGTRSKGSSVSVSSVSKGSSVNAKGRMQLPHGIA